ncbi:MAG: transcriptional regulator with XRE-family HTH domain [Planctomycetota bacterium]|jgi:transcriptional regulator with XRE-family HTH domain
MIVDPYIKIRILREIKGYTQENMAAELNLSTKAYQKIEVGETQLTINRLNQISEILEISPLEILNFDENAIFDKKPIKLIDENLNLSPNSSLVNAKNEQIEILKNEVSFLKEEIQFLRKIILKEN